MYNTFLNKTTKIKIRHFKEEERKYLHNLLKNGRVFGCNTHYMEDISRRFLIERKCLTNMFATISSTKGTQINI